MTSLMQDVSQKTSLLDNSCQIFHDLIYSHLKIKISTILENH